MSGITYVIIGNAVVWLGLAGYIVFLAVQGAGLDKRARQIELLEGDDVR